MKPPFTKPELIARADRACAPPRIVSLDEARAAASYVTGSVMRVDGGLIASV